MAKISSRLTRESWVSSQRKVYCEKGYGETSRALAAKRERYDRVLQAGLPGKARILDLGCNDGSFSKLLQEKGYEVTGVDFPEIIERAKRQHPDLDFIAHDIEELDFPERSFDAVIALGLIEHILHDIELLEKAYKWLDIGGRIFLTTPLSPEKIVEDEAAHIRFYPPLSLSRLLELAGFTVINLEIFQKIDEYFIMGEKNGKKSLS